MMPLSVKKVNNVFMEIASDDDAAFLELRDYFAFSVPNANQFKTSFVSWDAKKKWDGKIRLFNAKSHQLYIGLLEYLKDFSRQFSYDLEIDSALVPEKVDPLSVKKFIEAQDIGHKEKTSITSRWYQSMGLYHMLANRRVVLVSPTASGKSLMLYLFIKWFLLFRKGKVALIVPTTGLVLQMQADFHDYSRGAMDKTVHIIYSGKEKENPDARVYITTWQSVQYLPTEYFDKFKAVIVDEVHGASATQLKGILEKSQAEYRIGCTGTLQDTEAHKWVIEGLFGKAIDLISMERLMKEGWVSKLKIKCLVFRHPKSKETTGLDYAEELDYLLKDEKRNERIVRLAGHIKENQFVLFGRVAHGKLLYESIKERYPDRNVYLVYGATSPEEREAIRGALEDHTDSIVVASYQVFSVGVSINNLHHIVFAHPFKSKIRLLQSIGRTLRLHKDKEYATLWDLADMFTGSKLNFTARHFQQRVEAYNQQKLQYTVASFDV